jgi:hypothetical protein
MIRSGQTLPDDAEQYDAMADIKAHKSHVKVGPSTLKRFQLRELTAAGSPRRSRKKRRSLDARLKN